MFTAQCVQLYNYTMTKAWWSVHQMFSSCDTKLFKLIEIFRRYEANKINTKVNLRNTLIIKTLKTY